MKDDDELPTTSSSSSSTSTSTSISSSKKDNSSVLGKGRYKFWAIAAILLLAFWSMIAGTVSLRWSAVTLNRFSDDFDSPVHHDLDVLEMEEREKVVKHMWDVYTHSRRIRLPSFWQEAFKAAYEDMTSDDSDVRKSATLEIAKMSIQSIDLEPPPVQPTAARQISKSTKQDEKSKAL